MAKEKSTTNEETAITQDPSSEVAQQNTSVPSSKPSAHKPQPPSSRGYVRPFARGRIGFGK